MFGIVDLIHNGKGLVEYEGKSYTLASTQNVIKAMAHFQSTMNFVLFSSKVLYSFGLCYDSLEILNNF